MQFKFKRPLIFKVIFTIEFKYNIVNCSNKTKQQGSLIDVSNTVDANVDMCSNLIKIGTLLIKRGYEHTKTDIFLAKKGYLFVFPSHETY